MRYSIAATVPADAVTPEEALVMAIAPPPPTVLPGGWQLTDEPAAVVTDAAGTVVLTT